MNFNFKETPNQKDFFVDLAMIIFMSILIGYAFMKVIESVRW